MDQFVLVRMVKANGMDLAQFQFDYDLTFAVFLMNADGDIYGRFGTRSSHDQATQDISLPGFQKALEGALELHQKLPVYKSALTAKRGPAPRYATPELYPSLSRFKRDLDYEGKVAGSCIHCHQVQDAERAVWRKEGRRLPEQVLYPWPMPDVLGLKLDPQERATVLAVVPGSAAERAGFRAGDAIHRLNGQPLLSIADVQWVLHHAQAAERLEAEVLRDGKQTRLSLPLEEGWRRRSDFSWRTTTWDLRRMATGGMVLGALGADDPRRQGLPPESLALLVKHVGQYGEHAVAKRAGFQKDDVIVRVNDRTQPMRETDFLAYVLDQTKPGEILEVEVLRSDKRLPFELLMQ